MAGKSISYYEQKRDLPDIKELREEYKNIHSQVLQDVLLRLKRAFDRFFERVKNGEKPGYPRFQGRNRYTSFMHLQGGYMLAEKHVTLSKIGTIKCKVHRPLEGTSKTCTIKYESGQWYVVCSCECTDPEPLPVSYADVGIDLGVTHFAALSDGVFMENPRHYRKGEKTLQHRQQALWRKKRGSHRKEKAKWLVAKAHRKIRNQRKDFTHKQSRSLVNKYQLIVFADLQTANITRAPKPKQDEATGVYLPNGKASKAGLNKSMLDAGWGMFVAMGTQKAAWAARTVVLVNPKYTSQACSGCGVIRKKELSERWHTCECGCSLDRDTNAAINILRLGRSQQGAIPVEAPR
jgi:putative transposase